MAFEFDLIRIFKTTTNGVYVDYDVFNRVDRLSKDEKKKLAEVLDVLSEKLKKNQHPFGKKY